MSSPAYHRPQSHPRAVRAKQRLPIPQPASTILMATTYKPLPESYRKNGYDYTLLHRTERVALYLQEDAGKGIAFEVCRILRHEGRQIGESKVPPAEFLPSTEQWGSYAWTYATLPQAMRRFTRQDEHLQAATEAA